jgi:hypothetical protein
MRPIIRRSRLWQHLDTLFMRISGEDGIHLVLDSLGLSIVVQGNGPSLDTADALPEAGRSL